MRSFNNKKFFSFQTAANALGGFIEEPFQKIIPTLAPVSLPAAGGLATARSEAFNLDEIVSCSSAYSLVTGRESTKDGSISMLATAVVEDLNILEVVTAERIVAQLSVTITKEKGEDEYRRRISLAGSRFEGLRLAGRHCVPKLNLGLHQPQGSQGGYGSHSTWQDMQRVGREQAEKLINCFKDRGDEEAYQWIMNRHGWMCAKPASGSQVLCSLVDGIEGAGSNGPCGHIVDIAEFGRIFLGEILISPDSVQLVSIRAELGCPITGVITGPSPSCGGGGGAGGTSK